LLGGANLCVLILGLCGACSQADDTPAGAHVVRLLDKLADAQIDLPFDPTDPEAVISAQSTLLLDLDTRALADRPTLLIGSDGRLTDLAAVLKKNPGRVSGRVDNPTLTMHPPETLLCPLYTSDKGPLLVRAWVGGEDPSVAVLPLRGDMRPDLFNLVALGEQIERSGFSLSGPNDRSGSWWTAVVPADKDRSHLFLVAVARYRSIEFGRLEVRRLTPLAAALLGRKLRPTEEHVMLGDSAREALVLPAGGSVTWDLTLPVDAPRLDIDLGTLGVEQSLQVRWELGASVDGEQGVWRLDPAGPVWSPHSVDLAALAGRRVSLSLSVLGDQGAAVLGRPTINSSPAPDGERRPDVLLILLDTLRADRTAPGEPTTPRIQALADVAVRFTDASSTSAWTLPAHASLFNSRWPQTHRVTGKLRRLDESAAPVLARAFRDAGYETVAFTGGGFVSPVYGMAAGFERYGISDPCFGTRQDGPRAELQSLIAEPNRRPLFAFVHTFAAHHGMPRPDELARFGLDDKSFRRLRGVLQDLTVALEQQQPQEIDDASIDGLRSLYDASVLAADELVGQIVDSLVACGRFDETVLVVTSDHGQELFDRGAFGHGHQMHSEVLRIPLIVRAPGVAAQVLDAPVSLVDLAPTLRELAGLPADSEAQGRSLVGLLQGERLAPTTLLSHLVAVTGEPTHVYRREARSLHVDEQPDGSLVATALYDLSVDPHERDNLLARRPDAVATLLQAFEQELAALRERGVAAASEVSLDAETRQKLIELGYLSGH
jgi:arylsulfatase A-like enzyme